MFGIGLPEMILILALALIVVGPDKLPDLARTVAKGLLELKKTAEGLKESFAEEGKPLDEIRPDLEEAAKSFKNNLLDAPPYEWDEQINDSAELISQEENAAMAYKELVTATNNSPSPNPQDTDITDVPGKITSDEAVITFSDKNTETELPQQQDNSQEDK